MLSKSSNYKGSITTTITSNYIAEGKEEKYSRQKKNVQEGASKQMEHKLQDKRIA